MSLGLTARPDGYEQHVSDNGLGMPWNRRAEAFELFYRVGPRGELDWASELQLSRCW